MGEEVVLYTTDGDNVKNLNRGKIPNVYATVDFGLGKNPSSSFGHQRQVEPHGMRKIIRCSKICTRITFVNVEITHFFIKQTYFSNSGPLVNSEYYPGWLDFWGQAHNTENPSKVAKSFDDYLSYQNASVNVYMAHGGTSFGFETGMA